MGARRKVTVVEKARKFAEQAHEGARRRYTGEPFLSHPLEVARLVATVTDDPEVVAAALLHDVVEDTDVGLDEIRDEFGARVATLVSELTDISRPEDGNRARRKAIDLEHTAGASPAAKTIKLADLILNVTSIVQHDPRFSKIYVPEKRRLLGVLSEGDPVLYAQARDLLSRLSQRGVEKAP